MIAAEGETTDEGGTRPTPEVPRAIPEAPCERLVVATPETMRMSQRPKEDARNRVSSLLSTREPCAY